VIALVVIGAMLAAFAIGVACGVALTSRRYQQAMRRRPEMLP